MGNDWRRHWVSLFNEKNLSLRFPDREPSSSFSLPPRVLHPISISQLGPSFLSLVSIEGLFFLFMAVMTFLCSDGRFRLAAESFALTSIEIPHLSLSLSSESLQVSLTWMGNLHIPVSFSQYCEQFFSAVLFVPPTFMCFSLKRGENGLFPLPTSTST